MHSYGYMKGASGSSSGDSSDYVESKASSRDGNEKYMSKQEDNGKIDGTVESHNMYDYKHHAVPGRMTVDTGDDTAMYVGVRRGEGRKARRAGRR